MLKKKDKLNFIPTSYYFFTTSDLSLPLMSQRLARYVAQLAGYRAGKLCNCHECQPISIQHSRQPTSVRNWKSLAASNFDSLCKVCMSVIMGSALNICLYACTYFIYRIIYHLSHKMFQCRLQIKTIKTPITTANYKTHETQTEQIQNSRKKPLVKQSLKQQGKDAKKVVKPASNEINRVAKIHIRGS